LFGRVVLTDGGDQLRIQPICQGERLHQHGVVHGQVEVADGLGQWF
jgi:hypothetical protein